MSVTLYHNPRCSKCQATLQLLQDQNVEASVVEYLNTPPDAATLTELLQLLGLEPRQLMRRHEAEYEDNHLDDESLSREALIQAMVDHPILIERPIVVTRTKTGIKAAIGRPPKNVLEIL